MIYFKNIFKNNINISKKIINIYNLYEKYLYLINKLFYDNLSNNS